MVMVTREEVVGWPGHRHRSLRVVEGDVRLTDVAPREPACPLRLAKLLTERQALFVILQCSACLTHVVVQAPKIHQGEDHTLPVLCLTQQRKARFEQRRRSVEVTQLHDGIGKAHHRAGNLRQIPNFTP